MLTRYSGNPIIVPDPTNKLYSKKVYNSTVIMHQGIYYMFFRGVGDDWISRIFMASSKDGYDFEIKKEPVIFPETASESKGCEDPRVTYIDNGFWMCYTAFDGTARLAIAISDNIKDWRKHGLIFPELEHPQRDNFPKDWHKSAALFPEKLNGKFVFVFGDNHIWMASSDDLLHWEPNPTPTITARKGYFDQAYVEMGPPPIKTSKGWLILYHGIDTFDIHRTYKLGALLLSHDDPSNVIWRCTKPILEPTEIYETVGLIDLLPGGYSTLKNISDSELKKLADNKKLPKAVFCCGAIKEGDNIRLYYGAADNRICTASIDLDTIFAS